MVEFWPGFAGAVRAAPPERAKAFACGQAGLRPPHCDGVDEIAVFDTPADIPLAFMPDVIIYSVFGPARAPGITCAKVAKARFPAARAVQYSGECSRPDPTADACLTMDPTPGPGGNNFYCPLWAFRSLVRRGAGPGDRRAEWNDSVGFADEMDQSGWVRPTPPEGEREAFATFVFSNAVKAREEIAQRVGAAAQRMAGQGARVTFGGRRLNHLSPGEGPVSDKKALLRRHKFDLAFENQRSPGYITEKILDAYASGCIPVYWGAPDVSLTFRKSTFIDASDFDSPEHLAAHMCRVASDRALFESYFAEPILTEEWLGRVGLDGGSRFARKVRDTVLGNPAQQSDVQTSL